MSDKWHVGFNPAGWHILRKLNKQLIKGSLSMLVLLSYFATVSIWFGTVAAVCVIAGMVWAAAHVRLSKDARFFLLFVVALVVLTAGIFVALDGPFIEGVQQADAGR